MERIVGKKIIEPETKVEKLRMMRLADEAARKDAGTWGEMMVGEIMHEGTRSVFVQVWKGPSRPDPFRERRTRQPGVPASEWLAMTGWIKVRRATGFTQSVIARDISAEEAQKVAAARIEEHVSSGYTVINPAGATR
jgi:hypothetical protein